MDGAVVKVNDLTLREALGTTAKYPKWAVAYKYPPEQAETKLTDIAYQIGRSGVLTPVAVLDAVLLSGSRVKSATLHNFDNIAKKDIRIGDTVVVQKAGEIIPEVARSLKERRDGSEIEISPPSVCPLCQGEAARREGEVAHYCINPQCQAKIERQIIHFASRAAMNIEGLGKEFIHQLVEKGWVKTPADLYSLNAMELITHFSNMKAKSAENLIDSIEASKSAGLARLLFAIGIRNLGNNAAKLIADKFGSFDAIAASIDAAERALKVPFQVCRRLKQRIEPASSRKINFKLLPPFLLARKKAFKEEFTSIKGIGDSVYEAFQEFFATAENKEMIEKLKFSGVV